MALLLAPLYMFFLVFPLYLDIWSLLRTIPPPQYIGIEMLLFIILMVIFYIILKMSNNISSIEKNILAKKFQMKHV